MTRNFRILSIMMCMMLFMVGCTKKVDTPTISEETVNEENEMTVKDENEIVVSEEIEEEGVPSPISGIYTDEENIHKRPFVVMLDNQSKARPQAGLDQAEVVYEILAEGWITRYMAVFLINEPKLIGPVRSARPYFINKAMEYDALYVHVGGSPQAFSDIVTLKIPDIDAMSRGSNIFWRKNHKSMPHNMYTSAKAIRKAANDSNYREKGNYDTLSFLEKEQKINGSRMTYVKIPYYKNYKPSFKYNDEENLYYRFINDKAHLDEGSKKHLSAKNIIIQKAQTKVIDNKGRREIDLVGQGSGIYITNGEMMEVKWEKKSRRDLTRFYDLEGNEIVFNPGVTWIEVIPSNLELMME